MEGDTKSLVIAEKTDTGNVKKTKFLTLLLPSDTKEQKKDKKKPPTKVVIRRLPPRLTKELLLEELSPLPEHDYIQFTRGDLSLGVNAFSRACVNFVNQEDIFAFKEKFDDYVFKDDKGKEYHAVVEFAPFQKIPRRTNVKKKAPKFGTLETDPKYLEYLQKLEDSKNTTTSTPSEYFHETDGSTSKPKITTTPLLEYLKQKRQKRIDMKNEIRQRKRDAEWEKRRAKEDERRKSERDRRAKDDKSNRKRSDDKIRGSDKIRRSEDKTKDRSSLNKSKKDEDKGKKIEKEVKEVEEVDKETSIPNDPAILKVVVKNLEKNSESEGSPKSSSSREVIKASENETGNETPITNRGKKYSDFRTRLSEEKQRKTFHKNDLESRRTTPDEKGDNYSVGKETNKKYDKFSDVKKIPKELKNESKNVTETKSRYRYSEQRNRDREFRNSKASDSKYISQIESALEVTKPKPVSSDEVKSEISLSSSNEDRNSSKTLPTSSEKIEDDKTIGFIQLSKTFSSPKPDEMESKLGSIAPHCRRRKSLEFEKENIENERRRSKSLHDVADADGGEEDRVKCDSQDNSDGNISPSEKGTSEESMKRAMSNESNDDDVSHKKYSSNQGDDECKKDPRVERRIRNKDRPSIEIYRPGMGKFSKQRLDQKKEDLSPSGPVNSLKNTSSSKVVTKIVKKPSMTDVSDPKTIPKSEENENNPGSAKQSSEVRSMTFKRTVGKEN